MTLTEIVKRDEYLWAELRLWSEMYYDAQKVRVGMGNRKTSKTVDPDLIQLAIAPVKQSEEILQKHMTKCYKRVVPKGIQKWQKEAPGMGEVLLPRFLGHLGHPRIAVPKYWVPGPKGGDKRVLVEGEPYLRSVGQLWQYCGHGEVIKRRKGMTQEEVLDAGNPTLKMLVHLMAESAMKQKGGKYREIYMKDRESRGDVYDPTVKDKEERWSKGDLPKAHSNNRALRLVGKEILKDLWIVSEV